MIPKFSFSNDGGNIIQNKLWNECHHDIIQNLTLSCFICRTISLLCNVKSAFSVCCRSSDFLFATESAGFTMERLLSLC